MTRTHQGSATVGVKNNTHAVLVALKVCGCRGLGARACSLWAHTLTHAQTQRAPSELSEHQKKVFKVDEHAGISIAGLTADGRSLQYVCMRGREREGGRGNVHHTHTHTHTHTHQSLHEDRVPQLSMGI
jgi:20S proteasome alpha/beta subunit